MPRHPRRALLLLLVALILSASSVGAQPIKLGVILPLSGPFAALGGPTLDGIDAAIAEANEGGTGLKLERFVLDDNHTAAQTVESVKKLRQKERALVVLAPLNPVDLASVAADETIAVLQQTDFSRKADPTRRWVFNLVASQGHQAWAATEVLRQAGQGPRWFVQPKSWTADVPRTAFLATSARRGVSASIWQPSGPPEPSNAAGMGFYLPLTQAVDAKTAFEKAASQNLRGRWVLGTSLAVAQMVSSLRDAPDVGDVFAAMSVPGPDLQTWSAEVPELKRLQARFQNTAQKWRPEHGPFNVLGYQAVRIVRHALINAKDAVLTPENFRSALEFGRWDSGLGIVVYQPEAHHGTMRVYHWRVRGTGGQAAWVFETAPNGFPCPPPECP